MKKKLILFMICILLFSLTGCTKTVPTDTKSPESTLPEGVLPEGLPGENPGEGDMIAFKPSEMGILSQDVYDFPYAGMTVVLTKSLRDKMDERDVMMLSDEAYTEAGTLKYAALYWYSLTEEQKNEVVTALDPVAWKDGLGKIGVLGVYHTDSLGELDTLTGCTEHKEIGKSADGAYVYYLSFADEADEALKSEVEQTEVTMKEMTPLDLSTGKTAFSEGRINASNVGDFATKDINGADYSKEFFREYELTLVNVFTTWCSPCVEEMPELEKLKTALAEQGIGVAAVVYDAVNDMGETDQSVIDTALRLQEKAGITFPLLIPDETKMNGRLQGIGGFPESFFVDRDGNIVGEAYMGTHTMEEWKEIALQELANLKGEN